MIIMSVNNQDKVQTREDLLAVKRDDLDLCPEKASEADFLQSMLDWL